MRTVTIAASLAVGLGLSAAAAVAAGVARILILYDDRPLSRQERVAIQLSHNAINGRDDPALLKELWAEIDDLGLKYYAGLDDKQLEQLADAQFKSMREAVLDYKAVMFLFLPEEVEAPEVQGWLARMVEAGVAYVVVETTSHALVQERVRACDFDVAAFTNVGHDHLDYHSTWEEYLDAKARLIDLTAGAADKGVEKTAVLNRDDASYERLARRPIARRWSYGLTTAADLHPLDLTVTGLGSQFRMRTPLGETEVSLHVPARFNIYNALCAAGVCLALGVPIDAVGAGLAGFEGVRGRLEAVDLGQRRAAERECRGQQLDGALQIARLAGEAPEHGCAAAHEAREDLLALINPSLSVLLNLLNDLQVALGQVAGLTGIDVHDYGPTRIDQLALRRMRHGHTPGSSSQPCALGLKRYDLDRASHPS